MDNESISWRDLKALKSRALSACKIALAIVVADVSISLLLPTILPSSLYLSWYLHEDYDQVIDRFTANEMAVIPDVNVGWVNRPLYSGENWSTDVHGARQDSKSQPDAPRRIRVIMLGNSMINGGMHISDEETMSFYLENDTIESMNFGSMLHSLDQSFIYYKTVLRTYKPDVVVVGVNNDVYAVTNMFIPFRSPEERYMPFFKPRFVVKDNRLTRIRFPIAHQGSEANWQSLLEFLRKNDASFWRFESFLRFGIMPISSCIREGYLRIHDHLLVGDDIKKGLSIKAQIIREFERAASADGTKVIFLAFIDSNHERRNFLKRFLPNYDEMYLSMLRGTASNVISTVDVLTTAKTDAVVFYASDGIHFTPEANRVIANAIRERVLNLTKGPGGIKTYSSWSPDSPSTH